MKKSLIEKFSAWYIPLICKHKYKALLFYILLALVFAFPILVYPGLKLDADLAHLLPEKTPSVIALNESYERFGSTDRFMIAIQSEDVELVAALQDSIADYIHKNWQGDFVSTQVDNENQFFKDNALLYLPMKHLEALRDNLEDVQQEIGRKNGPLVVDLLGAPAEKKERIWFDANIPQELGLPDAALSAFDSFFKKKDSTQTEKSSEWNPKSTIPAHLKTRLIGSPQPDSTGKILYNGVVNAKLLKPSTDYEFVTRILAKTDTLLQHFNSQKYPVPTRFTVEGTYEGLKEVDDVANDSIFSFGISLVLIFLLTMFFFRSVKGPILVTGSVLYACLPTLAFTALFYGKFNPFTVFVASIILGIGIDYSIHILGTAQKLLHKYATLEEVLENAQSKMIKPFILASFTTIAAFLTLLASSFRGFYEFGIVASTGVLFSMLTSVLVLPVFVKCMGGIPAAPQNSLLPKSWSEEKIAKTFKIAAIIGFIIGAFSLYYSQYVDFEHNLKNLRRVSTEKTQKKNKISTKVTRESNKAVSSTPAAVMGSKPEQLDKLYDTLMVRLLVEKDSMLGSFLTLKSFVPPQDSQEQRLEIIEEIRDLANARVFDRATGDDSVNIANLRKLSQVEKTFTAEDIPEWTLDFLREKDGSYGKIGFIYGDFPSWDAKALHAFQERYGHWNFDGENLRTFSSQFILSDVIESVKADSFKLAGAIIVVIILTLAISFRKPKLFITGSISFGMGFLITMGILGFLTHTLDFGKISIYNVIVIPMTLGIGIDATIHFISAWTADKNLTLRGLLDTTGRNVMASSTTTIAGFVGFLFTTHRGLQGIGHLACIGIAIFLVTSIVFSMGFCGTLLKKKGE
ncbi:MAG: MMPL family transporter [Hallerella porci]|uniref:efflux RND transporter permease subunit n=1 Tax=Hallerella TaxID=2815788 RepID=UPI000D07A4CC|nr:MULTISPECIES: MMPL family transporter [Hallerella]MCI5600952.1 MMPL family transporter [Hallerella sp.]MDY3921583.1 MMPL family transporter [Hallerella porci]